MANPVEGQLIVAVIVATVISFGSGLAVGVVLGVVFQNVPRETNPPLSAGASAPTLEPHYPTPAGFAEYMAAKKNKVPWPKE